MDRVTTSKLEPPDRHHLNAASGWLELGNIAEAKAELAMIAASSRNHPEVLETQWQVHAAEKNWLAALDAARALVKAHPENPSGWIQQSYSLHELKRTREAMDLLLPALDKFSTVNTIPYNLACYACQLGDLNGARLCLKKAIRMRGNDDIKRMALTDLDLQPLWEEIREL